jgi:UDP-N-acetylmuramyl pentapeptide phosphotransferase/UDP-N-acetylglucosamine-1-phosphate transferase
LKLYFFPLYLKKWFIIYHFEIMSYLIIIILSIIILFAWLKIFSRLKVLDKPWNDLKNTRKSVPTMLGIFAFLWFFIIVLILFPEYFSNNLLLWLLAWSLPIIILETLEELSYIWKIKFKIHPIIRLLIHILWWILAVYIWWIWIDQEILIWTWKRIMPQYIFVIFFIIWSIICINAINRFDWIYAQASWVSTIWFLTIFLLIKFIVFTSYTVFKGNSLEILTTTQNLAFILFAISLISTLIEYKPLWLLRDIWIMFFGFSIAYLSVAWWAKIWTLLVALSLVIFDAIRVWFYRIFIMKKNPLKWDYTHLHHRLLWLWWTRREARASVWIRSIIMMVLMLLQWTDRLNKVIIFLIMALLFFWVNYYVFIVKKLPCWLSINK